MSGVCILFYMLCYIAVSETSQMATRDTVELEYALPLEKGPSKLGYLSPLHVLGSMSHCAQKSSSWTNPYVLAEAGYISTGCVCHPSVVKKKRLLKIPSSRSCLIKTGIGLAVSSLVPPTFLCGFHPNRNAPSGYTIACQ